MSMMSDYEEMTSQQKTKTDRPNLWLELFAQSRRKCDHDEDPTTF